METYKTWQEVNNKLELGGKGNPRKQSAQGKNYYKNYELTLVLKFEENINRKQEGHHER